MTDLGDIIGSSTNGGIYLQYIYIYIYDIIYIYICDIYICDIYIYILMKYYICLHYLFYFCFFSALGLCSAHLLGPDLFIGQAKMIRSCCPLTSHSYSSTFVNHSQ